MNLKKYFVRVRHWVSRPEIDVTDMAGLGSVVKLPAVDSGKILRLQDGDTIVFTLEESASFQKLTALRDVLAKRFPNNKVIVLEKGLGVSLVRHMHGTTASITPMDMITCTQKEVPITETEPLKQ